MQPGVANPPVTPAAPKRTFFIASCVPAAMYMKPMIIVGPPQAMPRISIPLAMMLSRASKLARLLTRTVPAVLMPVTNVASLPCGPIVPLVAPCNEGAWAVLAPALAFDCDKVLPPLFCATAAVCA